MDLIVSVREWVLTNLPYKPEPDVIAALNAMHPGSLLALYLNWRDRLVPRAPRQVLKSRAFEQNSIVLQRGAALTQIVSDIEHGSDLTKYLSRRVAIGFDLQSKPARKNLRRRQHLDLLLNDWGIHHLHVSTNIEADGFVERDGPLLYAVFRPTRAYLLDVMGHEDFENDRLLRIILDTWPDEGLVTELHGIRGSRQSAYSPEEKKELRSLGLSSMFQIDDGRVFFPAFGGMSTAGTSSRASVASNQILRTLKLFAEAVESDPNRIKETIRQRGHNPADKLEFEFAFFRNGYGVIETTSGTAIGLGMA